jgi:hypothetical protein
MSRGEEQGIRERGKGEAVVDLSIQREQLDVKRREEKGLDFRKALSKQPHPLVYCRRAIDLRLTAAPQQSDLRPLPASGEGRKIEDEEELNRRISMGEMRTFASHTCKDGYNRIARGVER